MRSNVMGMSTEVACTVADQEEVFFDSNHYGRASPPRPMLRFRVRVVLHCVAREEVMVDLTGSHLHCPSYSLFAFCHVVAFACGQEGLQVPW